MSCTKQMDEGMLLAPQVPIDFDRENQTAKIVTYRYNTAGCTITLTVTSYAQYAGIGWQYNNHHELISDCGTAGTMSYSWRSTTKFERVVFDDEVQKINPELPLNVNEWELIYEY